MPVITKPMLACSYDPKKARFPYILTPKVDGIRFVKVNGQILSRSFKPIRNKHVQTTLSRLLPDGVDGELTVGDNFQSSTSGIMSTDGSPDFKTWIFDYVDPIPPLHFQINTFRHRIHDPVLDSIPSCLNHEVLKGIWVHNEEELATHEMLYLLQGFEGVMLRDPDGTYKFGRSTQNENLLLKVKRFTDDEGTLISLEEKQSNYNPAQQDAFGRTKRSSAKAGMHPAGTLGALVVEMKDGRVVNVGSGLNDELRARIWHSPNDYIGKLVKFKYLPHGVKDLPRHPVFLGFRDPEDL
jgi:DNA ligase 1